MNVGDCFHKKLFSLQVHCQFGWVCVFILWTIYSTHYGRIAYGCCTLDIYFFMGKVKKVKSETDAKVAS